MRKDKKAQTAAAKRYLRAYNRLRGSSHRLGACLGSGTFGAVFEIHGADGSMAMKIIDPAAAGEQERAERTMLAEREIRIMRSLRGCEHIMPLLDSARLRVDDGTVYLLFMPVLMTLEDHLSHMSVLDLEKLAADMARALDALARAGLAHRDLCIRNIFVTRSGDFVLGDFGVSARVGEPNCYSHRGYRSPDTRASFLSDQFCLGAVLYYAAAGSGALLGRDGVVPDVDGVSGGMMRVIRTCLSIDPADRYQSAAALLEALQRENRGGTVRVNVPLLMGKRLYGDGHLTEALRIAQENAPDRSMQPLLQMLTYLHGVKHGDAAAGFRAWQAVAAAPDGDAKQLFAAGFVRLLHDPADPVGIAMLTEAAQQDFAPAQFFVGHAEYYDRHDQRGLVRIHAAARKGHFDALRVLKRIGALDEREAALYDALQSLPQNRNRRGSIAEFL